MLIWILIDATVLTGIKTRICLIVGDTRGIYRTDDTTLLPRGTIPLPGDSTEHLRDSTPKHGISIVATEVIMVTKAIMVIKATVATTEAIAATKATGKDKGTRIDDGKATQDAVVTDKVAEVVEAVKRR